MAATDAVRERDTARHNAKLLIVDDEPMNILLLRQILEHAGYHTIQSTTDSRQTRAMCQEFGPDLILLDMMMPHLDGIAVMAQLKEATPGEAGIPVLMLTADNSPQVKRRALASGARDILTKPFDLRELVLCIDNVLDIQQ